MVTVKPKKVEDHYAALGIPRNADEDEIKAAYRRLAATYAARSSDDMSDAERTAKMTAINNAKRDLLGDNRNKYDSDLRNWESWVSDHPEDADPEAEETSLGRPLSTGGTDDEDDSFDDESGAPPPPDYDDAFDDDDFEAGPLRIDFPDIEDKSNGTPTTKKQRHGNTRFLARQISDRIYYVDHTRGWMQLGLNLKSVSLVGTLLEINPTRQLEVNFVYEETPGVPKYNLRGSLRDFVGYTRTTLGRYNASFASINDAANELAAKTLDGLTGDSRKQARREIQTLADRLKHELIAELDGVSEAKKQAVHSVKELDEDTKRLNWRADKIEEYEKKPSGTNPAKGGTKIARLAIADARNDIAEFTKHCETANRIITTEDNTASAIERYKERIENICEQIKNAKSDAEIVSLADALQDISKELERKQEEFLGLGNEGAALPLEDLNASLNSIEDTLASYTYESKKRDFAVIGGFTAAQMIIEENAGLVEREITRKDRQRLRAYQDAKVIPYLNPRFEVGQDAQTKVYFKSDDPYKTLQTSDDQKWIENAWEKMQSEAKKTGSPAPTSEQVAKRVISHIRAMLRRGDIDGVIEGLKWLAMGYADITRKEVGSVKKNEEADRSKGIPPELPQLMLEDQKNLAQAGEHNLYPPFLNPMVEYFIQEQNKVNANELRFGRAKAKQYRNYHRRPGDLRSEMGSPKDPDYGRAWNWFTVVRAKHWTWPLHHFPHTFSVLPVVSTVAFHGKKRRNFIGKPIMGVFLANTIGLPLAFGLAAAEKGVQMATGPLSLDLGSRTASAIIEFDNALLTPVRLLTPDTFEVWYGNVTGHKFAVMDNDIVLGSFFNDRGAKPDQGSHFILDTDKLTERELRDAAKAFERANRKVPGLNNSNEPILLTEDDFSAWGLTEAPPEEDDTMEPGGP